MVNTFGNNIVGAYTGGVQVIEIWSNGVKVWPVVAPVPANNEIWYTTNTDAIITPVYYRFGATLLTNTYSGGKGVMTFDGPVTRIGNMVFENTYELLTMTLPDTVTSIGEYAFENCEELHTINIPSGVTSIGQNAFNISTTASHRGRLRSITIPSGVTRIENRTFQNQGIITSVTIPSGVTYMGESVFERCSHLETVIMEPSVPPTLTADGYGAYNQFLDCSSNLQIKVPAASLNAYLTAPGWSTYASKIVGYSDTDEIDFSTLGLDNAEVVDVDTYGAFSSGDMQVQFSTVSSSVSKYYESDTTVRIYNGNSVTISSSTKTISQIEFTWRDSSSYRPSSDVATPSGYDYQTYIWTGSASQVTLTYDQTSGTWRLKSVRVTYQ